MDEELYAKNIDVFHRGSQSLISEFRAVRASTEQLFENLTEALSKFPCNIVTHPMTVRAIGYLMIGLLRYSAGAGEQLSSPTLLSYQR
jgi:hypothetical protein